MVVTAGRKATSGSFEGFLVTATSVADITKQDVVKALITVK
jgi:hypothetical protein